MSLSKKSSQVITVSGVEYRWAPAPDSGCINVVVQATSGVGWRLVVNVGGYEDADGAHRSIAPALVRRVILAAIDAGWRPDETGGELYVHWDGAGVAATQAD